MRFIALALACFFTTASAQIKSDWERENEDRLKQSDEQVVPAPQLDKARLVEVKLPPAAETDFQYYVDPASVSIGADRIVRYVLVARSPSGADNVTFEGMRCPGEYRVYAVGRPDGSWGGRPTAWRPIVRDARVSQNTLSRNYFCPGRHAISTSEEGQKAVRTGGHPGVFTEQR